jgi:hypothetical protein
MGLLDEARPGAPRRIGDEEIAETIRLTLKTTPRHATQVAARDRCGGGSRPLDDPSDLEGFWPAATSGRNLQAFD